MTVRGIVVEIEKEIVVKQNCWTIGDAHLWGKTICAVCLILSGRGERRRGGRKQLKRVYRQRDKDDMRKLSWTLGSIYRPHYSTGSG